MFDGKSAHLTQAPTRPQPVNAGSASRNTDGRVPHVPRALGGPFAGSLRGSFQPGLHPLCACAAGLISASTVYHSVAPAAIFVNTGRVFPMFSINTCTAVLPFGGQKQHSRQDILHCTIASSQKSISRLQKNTRSLACNWQGLYNSKDFSAPHGHAVITSQSTLLQRSYT